MRYKSANNAAEAELIMFLHEGHEKALTAIFDLYHLSLFYFSCQLLNNKRIAEDIVAESFCQLWERKEEFGTLEAVKTFLYTAVKKACFEAKQSSRRRSMKAMELSAELFAASAEAKMVKAELLGIIMKDIGQLSPARRKIFKMLFVEGYDPFEVARILKVSVDTVRVQKARSLHLLRLLARKKWM